MLAVLHDLDVVRERFPEALLLRASPWPGPDRDTLAAANLLRARRMCEAFHEGGAVCRQSAA